MNWKDSSVPPPPRKLSDVSPKPPPPPSLDVRVRTMRSDIETIGTSGGALPTIPTIGAGLAQKPPPEGAYGAMTGSVAGSRRAPSAVVVGAVALGAILVFLAGYYLVPRLLGGGTESEVTLPPGGESAVTDEAEVIVPQPPSPDEVGGRPAPPARTTLFENSDHPVVPLRFDTSLAGTAAQTAYERGLAGLAAVPHSAPFVEVLGTDEDGVPLPWEEFAPLVGFTALDPDVVGGHFEDTFSFFFYRDGNALWPGVVFVLKPEELIVLLRDEVARLEGDPLTLIPFFIETPGAPRGTFTDAQVAEVPVRRLAFQAKGAAFIYGWVNNRYLVVSTSEEGFAEAAQRLP